MVEVRDDNEDNTCRKIGSTSRRSTDITQASSSQDESLLSWESSTSKVSKTTVNTRHTKKSSQKRRGTSRRGVHDRLYARSKAKQEEGREKRQQIAESLAPKPPPPIKKISAEKATSLFDRLYDDGVQKLISLGRKKNALDELSEEEKSTTTIITNSKQDDLYNRLYSDAMTKQLKDMHLMDKQRPKAKIISKKQANSLYERLYLESTLSTQRARGAEE